jgi:uncharacterized membrane protein
MNNKFENRHSDDPNAITTDDREVMEKTSLTGQDVKNALNENNVAQAMTSGKQFPETGPKLIFGVLLVITGIFIAFITAWTIFGIIIGALLVIGGIYLPFSNFGVERESRGSAH